MRKARIAASAFFCAASLAAGTMSRAGSGVPELVQRAAAFNAADMSGVIVAERHVTFNASAGPAHFSQQNDAIVMLQDGEYKRIRYLRIVENGKAYSVERLAQKEAESNADLEQGKSFFKEPFDARYLRDYRFSDVACTCAAGERQIAFVSLVRDDQHGDGTMTLESSTGRVMTITYTPNVLSARANAGTTTETFGQTAGGVWTTVEINRQYSGRIAFIKGSGTMIERLDHVTRFSNAVSGMQYLQRASL